MIFYCSRQLLTFSKAFLLIGVLVGITSFLFLLSETHVYAKRANCNSIVFVVELEGMQPNEYGGSKIEIDGAVAGRTDSTGYFKAARLTDGNHTVCINSNIVFPHDRRTEGWCGEINTQGCSEREFKIMLKKISD